MDCKPWPYQEGEEEHNVGGNQEVQHAVGDAGRYFVVDFVRFLVAVAVDAVELVAFVVG